MHQHDERAPDAIHKSIRAAIVVFACLGALQLSVAVAFHRVALGVDGAHNLVDGLVLFINLRARYWIGLERRSALACIIEPLAPAFSSVLVVVSAIGFTVLEALAGGGNESHIGLAIVLLAASLLANAYFTMKLHGAHNHDRHSLNALIHLALDAAAALVGLVAYITIALGSSTNLDVLAAWLGTLIIVVGHRNQIVNGVKEFVRHRKPGHIHTAPEPGLEH